MGALGSGPVEPSGGAPAAGTTGCMPSEDTLLRCMEHSGLSCGAAYSLTRLGAAVLESQIGFDNRRALEHFFGHRGLLGAALHRAGGRVTRLGATGIDPSLTHSVLARARLSVIVLVPLGPPLRPTAAIVLAAPRTTRPLAGGRGGHTQRVSRYSYLLATLSGIPGARSELIGAASALHDVGKLVVDEDVLLKPGPLDPAERRLIQRHAQAGRLILAGQPHRFTDLAAEIAWTHHERWDGEGYPRRLRGEEIPVEGRIVAIADVFDALTSDRPYRPAIGVDAALDFMQASGGFDPGLLARFVAAVPSHIEPAAARSVSRRPRPAARLTAAFA